MTTTIFRFEDTALYVIDASRRNTSAVEVVTVTDLASAKSSFLLIAAPCERELMPADAPPLYGKYRDHLTHLPALKDDNVFVLPQAHTDDFVGKYCKVGAYAAFAALGTGREAGQSHVATVNHSLAFLLLAESLSDNSSGEVRAQANRMAQQICAQLAPDLVDEVQLLQVAKLAARAEISLDYTKWKQ